LIFRLEDTFRVRLHLPSAPGSGAALCQGHRASSLPPPNRAIQKPGANSPLDKIWGQGH
jgi:hypothetical protein